MKQAFLKKAMWTGLYQPGQSFGGLDTSECCVEMISRRTNQKSVGKDLFLKVTSPCLDNVVAKLYTTLTTHFLYFLFFRKALGSLTILTTMFKKNEKLSCKTKLRRTQDFEKYFATMLAR